MLLSSLCGRIATNGSPGLKMTFNVWLSCLSLTSAGVTGVHYRCEIPRCQRLTLSVCLDCSLMVSCGIWSSSIWLDWLAHASGSPVAPLGCGVLALFMAVADAYTGTHIWVASTLAVGPFPLCSPVHVLSVWQRTVPEMTSLTRSQPHSLCRAVWRSLLLLPNMSPKLNVQKEVL